MDIYNQTLEFLFNRLQAFHRVGAAAYKPGLHTTLALSEAFGSPHVGLRTIHVAGTNGKGSTAHTLAAVLQAAGMKVGLFTSPHLLDFNERIRVNGKPISHEAVIDFAERFKALRAFADGTLDPSFFELSTVMAFEHFRREHVDVAVIEVGLGGRLDSTNVITPDLSVITNISLDHTALLGSTTAEIAAEKAGIIKPGIPAVIGEADADTRPVFTAKAAAVGAPVIFARDSPAFKDYDISPDHIVYRDTSWGDITSELIGEGQWHNANTVMMALQELKKQGYPVTAEAVREGFAHVTTMTGLMGRWQQVSETPRVICDTGHNPGAWQYTGPRLARIPADTLHIVLGFAADKDISNISRYLPRGARYYFVRPDTPRAAAATDVADTASVHGIHGSAFPSVAAGWHAARAAARPTDTIFVGGSNFVVADFLNCLN
ncbi:MAG: bifunctional folylpolyglutamate synthase/dihydrofolate synthase [Muribaculaceae bacterium]